MTAETDLELLSPEERSLVERLAGCRLADPPESLRREVEASLVGGRVRRRRWWLAAAAGLLVAVPLGVWLCRPGRPGPQPSGRVYEAPSGGGLRSVALADGLIAQLAPGAHLEDRDPDGPGRRVRLARGRGRFDLACPAVPFVVETAACDVRATGTQFEVNVVEPLSQGGPEMSANGRGRTFVAVAVLAGAVCVFNPQGEVALAAGEQAVVQTGQPPAKANIDALAAMFTDHYKPVAVDVKPAIPAVKLPVDLSAVANYAAVNPRVKADRFKDLLTRNGFAVAPWEATGLGHLYDVQKAYKTIKEWEVPVFVTSDSLLHLYHIQFGETLKSIEERVFAADLEAMLAALQKQLLADLAKADAKLKPSLELALGQVSVALKLLTDTAGQLEPLKAARAAAEKIDPRRDWRAIGEFNKTHAQTMELFLEIGKQLGLEGPYIQGPDRAKTLATMDRVIAHVEKSAAADPAAALPADLKARVADELKLIAAHQGQAASPLFTYKEDYSQYVPRGHYTRSELLKRYFKAMMCLGRMTYLLKGKQDVPAAGISAIVDTAEARRQTIAATHLTRLLMTGQAADGRKLADIWQRIYAVTAYYVGVADDLSFRDYADALAKVLGAELDASKLLDDKTFFAAKVELARLRGPAIYSGTGDVVVGTPAAFAGVPSPEDLAKVLDQTMGLRVMGQRFVPDSYAMGKLVFPTVGAWSGGAEFAFTTVMTRLGPRRCFPRGLDVLAVFGSDRAAGLVGQVRDNAYEGYDKTVGELRGEFGRLTTLEWNRNLYWSWVFSLNGLVLPVGEGYPTFMQTPAWQDRQVHAACASWSQLRHDTILYAKQSYTMVGAGLPPRPKDVPGYVEPSVEFYTRLLALARMTTNGLGQMKVLDDAAVKRLETLDRIIQQLLDISVKELADKPLAPEEYEFIKFFGERLSGTLYGVDEAGRDTRIIADVHTDGNSRQVLEEGTGPLDLMLVIYRLPDGTLGMGVGPTLSYYEFKHPMADRLTDEAWRGLLTKERDKSAGRRPNWTGSFLAPAGAN